MMSSEFFHFPLSNWQRKRGKKTLCTSLLFVLIFKFIYSESKCNFHSTSNEISSVKMQCQMPNKNYAYNTSFFFNVNKKQWLYKHSTHENCNSFLFVLFDNRNNNNKMQGSRYLQMHVIRRHRSFPCETIKIGFSPRNIMIHDIESEKMHIQFQFYRFDSGSFVRSFVQWFNCVCVCALFHLAHK